MGNVLVTGATGGIGRALVGALTEAGHRVIAVGRDVGRLDVRGIEADLAEPTTLATALVAQPERTRHPSTVQSNSDKSTESASAL
ncbi:SDR family NAD(P)-dependent oxidoreductase [Streptosporangium saharense]|uniref:SDR family NAD(P)-dependent oxidoreductase n=1 Tax=Streptosporangium saharense TaxID=1706840 RepID=UPI00342C1526